MPALSIITVNFNNKTGLFKTFESVFSQTFKDFEYIVIDGGSGDGSKEIIEENQQKISYWVSEKDKGIYHAMNKGIKRATGEYLLFLNSGDYLCDALVLSKVFANGLTYDIVYGDIIWDTNGVKSEQRFPDSLSFDYFARQQFLPHQGTFIRRSLFEYVGLYDEQQRIISDWIFFALAICKHNCSYNHINIFISICGRDGISCQEENFDSIIFDRKKELQRHFPAFIRDYEVLQSLRNELGKVNRNLVFRIQKRLNRLRRKDHS